MTMTSIHYIYWYMLCTFRCLCVWLSLSLSWTRTHTVRGMHVYTPNVYTYLKLNMKNTAMLWVVYIQTYKYIFTHRETTNYCDELWLTVSTLESTMYLCVFREYTKWMKQWQIRCSVCMCVCMSVGVRLSLSLLSYNIYTHTHTHSLSHFTNWLWVLCTRDCTRQVMRRLMKRSSNSSSRRVRRDERCSLRAQAQPRPLRCYTHWYSAPRGTYSALTV